MTLLNFMITPLGLQDQLLGYVVAEEKPELEAQKNELIVRSAANKSQLKQLEDQILSVLSTSQGNILEDESAIRVLAESKAVSTSIQEDQKIAEVAEAKIDATRNGYVPVVARAAVLFFCIADLATIDPMYQYSLGWFINLFVQSIRDSKKSADLASRITILNDYFTYSLYLNVCRSLFEKDKLLFSLHLCVRLLQSTPGAVDEDEYQFLLTSGGSLGLAADVSAEANPTNWLPDRSWMQVKLLSLLPTFKGFDADFSHHAKEWRAIYDSPEPHKVSFPGSWKLSLSGMQKLLVLRCLRPDKMVVSAQSFVVEALGERFTEPPPFDLAGSFNDSNVQSPIIFVLSPGVDPMNQLVSFAEQKGVTREKLHSVSLGQGQGPIAEELITRGIEKVILKF